LHKHVKKRRECDKSILVRRNHLTIDVTAFLGMRVQVAAGDGEEQTRQRAQNRQPASAVLGFDRSRLHQTHSHSNATHSNTTDASKFPVLEGRRPPYYLMLAFFLLILVVTLRRAWLHWLRVEKTRAEAAAAEERRAYAAETSQAREQAELGEHVSIRESTSQEVAFEAAQSLQTISAEVGYAAETSQAREQAELGEHVSIRESTSQEVAFEAAQSLQTISAEVGYVSSQPTTYSQNEDGVGQNLTQNASRQESRCVVCLGTSPTIAVIPCGHRCLCGACASVFQRSLASSRCPLCRGKISAMFRIFE
jgi:hypothetical protein